jgi:hypothetical protein
MAGLHFQEFFVGQVFEHAMSRTVSTRASTSVASRSPPACEATS